jgi:large-conductance mechanosensitive channel
MVLKQFNEFVMRNGVMFGISVAILSAFINELVGSLINDIIFPLFETTKQEEKDKYPDLRSKMNSIVYTFNGKTIRYGSFLYSLIRFMILIGIIFIVVLLIKKTDIAQTAGAQTTPSFQTMMQPMTNAFPNVYK